MRVSGFTVTTVSEKIKYAYIYFFLKKTLYRKLKKTLTVMTVTYIKP
jgi:hypothetical protein